MTEYLFRENPYLVEATAKVTAAYRKAWSLTARYSARPQADSTGARRRELRLEVGGTAPRWPGRRRSAPA